MLFRSIAGEVEEPRGKGRRELPEPPEPEEEPVEDEGEEEEPQDEDVLALEEDLVGDPEEDEE